MNQSVINLKYSQPDFYHFNEDSIALVNLVFKRHQNQLDKVNILDLMCGCGVIGYELLLRSRDDFRLTFVEIQEEYFSHLRLNKELYFNDAKISFIHSDYQKLSSSLNQSFDLILCNPPYFNPGIGRISQNANRNICRHFSIGNYKSLLEKIIHLLKGSGVGYLVLRDCFTNKEMTFITNFNYYESKIKLELILNQNKRKIYSLMLN